MFKVPEKYRVTTGPLRSDRSFGNNGAFSVRTIKFNRTLQCIASDGEFWEHVSVSVYDRCPTWEEMCFIKSLFWSDDDLVIQLHPVKSEYVNNHQFCLHLWRKAGTNDFCETPPAYMVGIKSKVDGIGGGETVGDYNVENMGKYDHQEMERRLDAINKEARSIYNRMVAMMKADLDEVRKESRK